MVPRTDRQKLLNYLYKHDYLDVFIFLILSLDDLENRSCLVEQNLKELKEKMDSITRKATENPDGFGPGNIEIHSMFKDVHYMGLEIIQKLNILAEMLAVYYHMIRTENIRKLPKCIGKRDFRPRKLRAEFDYFKEQTLDDIWKNFKYPDVRKFPELSSEQQDALQQMLKKSAENIAGGFKEIYKFQKNFREVYNKYKHTLSEITGVFGFDKKRKQIQTHVFVRHKEKDKFYTYVFSTTPSEINYFREIAARIYKILHALIDSALLHIANEENNFMPRTLFVEENCKTKLKEITEKVCSCVMPEFTSKVAVKPPEPEVANKINKKLQEDHIYRMNKDILNVEELFKSTKISQRDKPKRQRD